MKTRVPGIIKRAIAKIASQRFTSESEIAREAFIEYLERHGVSLHAELHDEPGAAAPPAVVQPPAQPVHYSRKKKSSSGRRPKTDIAAEGIAALEKDIKRSSGSK